MAPNDLVEYFRIQTQERSVRAIALRAGLDQSTLNRQLNGTTSLTVETVVAIARAYDLDFADTFIAVGFITADEARRFSRRFSLSDYSDQDLTLEIVRRVNNGSATTLTEPVAQEAVDEVLGENATGHDSVPYIGRVSRDEIPEKVAADKRRKRSDQPHAE
jgi:transcriptional regulator with XRE-family HTH domain